MPARRRFPVTRGARRQVGWDGGPGTGAAFTSTSFGAQEVFTTSGQTVFAGGSTAGQDGLTLVRLRGQLLLTLESVTAVGDGFTGAIGIGIASSEAFAAGVASLPDPLVDIARDVWWWHTVFALSGSDDAGSPTDAGGATFRTAVDSKAMRKIHANQTVFAVIRRTIHGAAQMNAYLATRMLSKLP